MLCFDADKNKASDDPLTSHQHTVALNMFTGLHNERTHPIGTSMTAPQPAPRHYLFASSGQTYPYGKARFCSRPEPADLHIDDHLESVEQHWHISHGHDILEYLAATLWLAEPCPYHVQAETLKQPTRSMTRLVTPVEAWNPTTARLFSIDCANDILPLVQHLDPRTVTAIDAAARYTTGDVTLDELNAIWQDARDAANATTDTNAYYVAITVACAAAPYRARHIANIDAMAAVRATVKYATQAAIEHASATTPSDTVRATTRETHYRRLIAYLQLDTNPD